MQTNEKYIQMTISSTEEISKELIGILSARNARELSDAMGTNRTYWIRVFEVIKLCDFSHLKEYKSYSHASNYSYISLPSALTLIPNFSYGCKAYGTQESQEKKFKQLLTALSFIDCDIFVTLVLKRFRWCLVDKLLKLNNGATNG